MYIIYLLTYRCMCTRICVGRCMILFKLTAEHLRTCPFPVPPFPLKNITSANDIWVCIYSLACLVK